MSPKYNNCIISEQQLVLNSEQYTRKDYYEMVFKDVLEVVRRHEGSQLDLTMLETSKQEVFILKAPASLRRDLRKRFGDGVTERIVRGKGSSGLCRLHGFS